MPQVPDLIKEKLSFIPGFTYHGESHAFYRGMKGIHRITHSLATDPTIEATNPIALGIKNIQLARDLAFVFQYNSIINASNRTPEFGRGLTLGRLAFTEAFKKAAFRGQTVLDSETPNTPQWEKEILEILEKNGSVELRKNKTYEVLQETEIIIFPDQIWAELSQKYWIAYNKGLVAQDKLLHNLRNKIPLALLKAHTTGELMKHPSIVTLNRIPDSNLE